MGAYGFFGQPREEQEAARDALEEREWVASMQEGWRPMAEEPRDGSPIWLSRLVNGEYRDIRPGISNNLPTTWPTHWKPRELQQPST